MTSIRDLTTGTKLTLAFGFMAVLMVFVGFEGVRGMAGLRENAALLYERDALGVIYIKEANVNLLATQNAVRAALLDENADRWQAEARKREANFWKEFGEYRGTLTDADDIGKAEEVEKLFKELREVQDSLFGLVKSGAKVQARGMWANLDPLVDALNGALDELSQRKVAAMRKTAEDTRSSYTTRRGLVIGAILAALIAATALALFITRMIARPLGRAVQVLEAVAGGDFTPRLDVTDRDEIGRMAAALNQALESVSEALLEVSAAADRTAIASRQMSGAAQHMSTGAQEQASSLEETAASLEEITGTLKATADNATQASKLAVGSRSVAEKGGSVVATTVDAMGKINAASKKIVDIIATIDAIAFQTNLLALNAAVEAARAGEHGHGFAVVASEVRNLAQRSATAAKEIKDLIQDSVAKVETGTALVNQSGETLSEIIKSAKQVTDIVAEIAAASKEQSTGVDQVNRAVSQMEQVTQSNAAQTEEISSTAEALAAQAGELQVLIGRFRVEAQRGRAALAYGAPGIGHEPPVQAPALTAGDAS
jgi:methyl-accepting chemotaxis protein